MPATPHRLPASSADHGLNSKKLWLLLLLFGLIWLSWLNWLALTPPIDDVEQLVWVRSLQWGYYKHPPLPTWLLAPVVQVFGLRAWSAYALGASCTLGAMALMWQVLRDMRGSRYASIILLANLCITFYTFRLYYYNHNDVMLLASSVAIALLWRVTRKPSLWAWAGIGVAIGLGMLGKYQTVLVAASIALWWIYAGLWRQRVHLQGAFLAAILASLIFSPHLWWLIANDWLPLRYAENTSIGAHMSLGQRPWHILNRSLDWLLNRAAPAWVVLGITAWAVRRQHQPDACPLRPAADQPDQAPKLRQQRIFLSLFGILPMLIMMGMSLLGGVDLQKHWATAFMLWTVPAVLEWLPRWRHLLQSPQAPVIAWRVFLCMQVFQLLLQWSGSARGPLHYRDHHWDHFPSQALAQTLERQLAEKKMGPIDIIAGAQGPVGAITLHLPEQPRVLIQGQLEISPWIKPDELQEPGKQVIEIFPTDTLPADAQWLGYGWAWRPGISALADRLSCNWKQQSWQAGPNEAPAHDLQTRDVVNTRIC